MKAPGNVPHRQHETLCSLWRSSSAVGETPTPIGGHTTRLVVTKASEASWSYSCDSKVSFDRVQILTPDFSGRRPPSSPSPPPPLSPPHLPSPPPCLPPTSTLPPSLPPSLFLRKFDSVLSSLFGMRLALRILRPHSLTLTVSLSLSLITKASEASWSYSCDSKVSFDRVQILTPDFSGRRPPPTPPPEK